MLTPPKSANSSLTFFLMSDQNDQIASYYESLIAEHGHHPRSCDYGRPESQQTKFEVLSEISDYSGKSILDVGCGFADFIPFLEGKFKGISYHGVDITPSMAKAAAERHPDHRIECRDILSAPPKQQYDLVTSNGIFYLAGENARDFMHKMVTHMFSLATEAVAFNTLSTWADFMNDKEFYADPAETLEFCKSLTPKVTLRHDYMNHDFTVYLYK